MIKITSINCELTEKVYHLRINYNGNNYFFIVQTFQLANDKELIRSIKRGKAHFDCGLTLKASEKRQIRNRIDMLFSFSNASIINELNDFEC